MSTTESSFQSRRPQRLSVAAVLAALAIGAGFYGLRSRLALAEPEPTPPPHAEMSLTVQSMQMRIADADADVGPGQCEPVLVGME